MVSNTYLIKIIIHCLHSGTYLVITSSPTLVGIQVNIYCNSCMFCHMVYQLAPAVALLQLVTIRGLIGNDAVDTIFIINLFLLYFPPTFFSVKNLT